MERRKFEDSWKEAFDQAEISPSENVWTNIELDLEKAKARKLKRRLVFYQLLAAASVVFAMGIGLSVYVNSNNPSANEMLAIQQTVPSTSAPEVSSGSEHNREISPDQLNTKEDNASDERSETDLNAGAASQQADVRQPQNNTQATEGRSGKESQNTVANAASAPETSRRPSALSKEQSDAHRAATNGNTANSIAQAPATDNTQGSALRKQGLTKEQGITGEEARVAANATDEERNDKLSAKENGFSAAPETTLAADHAQLNKNALSRGEAIAATAEKEDAAAVYPPSFERKLPELVAQRKPELILPQQAQADPVALMLAKLERREQEVREQGEKTDKSDKKEERSNSENLWTSVGVAAGSFNPVVARNQAPSSASLYASSRLASNATKEMKAKGATYSVGVNMGTRLSDRWVLQGGVNYLTQTSDYTQNGLIQRDMNSNTLKLPSNFNQDEIMSTEGDAKSASIVDTPPYNVNNSVRYLSVPMQAGYMLISKDFGLQLNAGVSTDLLLQNNITATVDGEAVESDYEGSGYRQVNLSGLMGTELSYRFGRRYRLALNPGVRYPFTNIYKSEDFRATRLSFDVGLRFRYIFK